MFRLRSIVCFLLLAGSTVGLSQHPIRIMSYNLLNFPSPSPPGRLDTLSKILSYYKPNLFIMQELRSEGGLFQISQRINTLGFGSFAHATYVPLMSNPFNSFAQVQGLIYDTDIFSFKSQHPILTSLRDINEYVLYFNTPTLVTGDTTFLYIYACHLRAGTGSTNSNERLSMVNSWLDDVDGRVSPNDYVLFAGDFNVYNNSEPAYQALVNPASPLPLNDVFASLGNWSNAAFPHKYIHTQSTRVNSIFGDGAGSGMDDRFDFILFSNPLTDPDHLLHYVDGSYLSLGNNGTCYDQNITDCADDNEVPFDILRAMYFMSDHLPQVCELEYMSPIGVTNIPEKPESRLYLRGDLLAHYGYCIESTVPHQRTHSLSDLTGRVIVQWTSDVTSGSYCEDFPDGLPSGLYLFRSANRMGIETVDRVVVQAK